MSSATILQAAVRLLAVMLVVYAALCALERPARAGEEAGASAAAPVGTGKERLGSKASDEQRVDNCKVPPALRGPKPRPDECGDGASTNAKR
ncbi:MAG TPA: hypothetical protein VH934_02360 [Xanthobacteraceae bacterium]|jgi:hypothetical protein